MLLALFLLNIIGVVAIGMLAWHAYKKRSEAQKGEEV